MSAHPIVSILVITWNSKPFLSICLEKICAQSFRNFEVIIVDNGSTDDSFGESPERFKEIVLRVERLGKNHGFAVANNIGARLARGKWLALLNTDAYPEPDWLENLLKAAEANPDYAAFSSRQIQFNAPHLLDGAGDAYHISGLAWRNAYNFPSDKYGMQQKEVFSPCGAAALYSRQAFLRAGGFDEDYFSYFEDVDLGFRLRLRGAKCLYVPEAVVHHVGSASTGKRSNFSIYYGYRNLIWTYFKDMPFLFFWIFLPLHIGTILFFTFHLTMRGQGKIMFKSIYDAVRGLPGIMRKRRSVQRTMRIKPLELLTIMSTGLFEPYREFRQRNWKGNNI